MPPLRCEKIKMGSRRRVLYLIGIMVVIGLIVETITIALLYRAAIDGSTARFREIAQSQANLIRSIAEFADKYGDNYPEGVEAATLNQIIEAYNNCQGFGKTGSFSIAKKEGDEIVFLLKHNHSDVTAPKPIKCGMTIPTPMALAISGQSGIATGPDCYGKEVVAAYEPVGGKLNWGIVAKIERAEIREPLINAAIWGGLTGLILVVIGAIFFVKITNPLILKLSGTIKSLEQALNEVKTLSGLLPICASCKKIRDDKGYWNKIESYISEHTEAEFSHSYCNDCIRKLYPDIADEVIAEINSKN